MSTKTGNPFAALRQEWQGNNLCLSFVILGASGDLAYKYLFPTLTSLFGEKGFWPKSLRIIGFGRSELTAESLRDQVRPALKGDDALKDRFLQSVSYVQGDYDSAEAFQKLSKEIEAHEAAVADAVPGRLFYFALPPEVYGPSLTQIKDNCTGERKDGWLRIVAEKPFGRDLASSEALSDQIDALFTEEQVYRMDHYLGKESVQNMLVMRFGNMVLASNWNREHVQSVHVRMKETVGAENRIGYFDNNGIIRDDIQNHVMQVLTLVAMERPASLDAADVHAEKAKVTRAMRVVRKEDVVLGQYTAGGDGKPGYLDNEGVAPGSKTPTFACIRMFIDNERWEGVPFYITAGKSLDEKVVDVRVQFKTQPGLFAENPHLLRNEFVAEIAPKEALTLKMVVKKPGLGLDHVLTDMSLDCGERYNNEPLFNAYERMILDVINGNQQHFQRRDELKASWAVFTPVLEQIERGEGPPLHLYPNGSAGPEEGAKRLEEECFACGGRYLPDGDQLMHANGYVRHTEATRGKDAQRA